MVPFEGIREWVAKRQPGSGQSYISVHSTLNTNERGLLLGANPVTHWQYLLWILNDPSATISLDPKAACRINSAWLWGQIP